MCTDLAMLSAYLDGELEESVRASVEEHLLTCPACRKRLEELREVDEIVRSTALPADELDKRRGETLAYLEGKYFNGAKVPFFRRRLDLSFGAALGGIAAAAALVFAGSFLFFGSDAKETEEILPSFSVQAGQADIVYVSEKPSLDSYTLDEILKYLDNCGYKVDISIKGVEPVEE